MGRSQKTPCGHSANFQQIMGYPTPVDVSILQFLHLWISEHHRRGDRKIFKGQNTKKSVMKHFFSWKQDQKNDNINKRANVEGKKLHVVPPLDK